MYLLLIKGWFLFLFCSLLSSKNIFNFSGDDRGKAGGGGGFYIFNILSGRGSRTGSIILHGIQQGEMGSRKHNFEGDVIMIDILIN